MSRAQEQSTSAAVESEGGLDEIVVTAQRRQESAQRAAVAITVVGGNALVEAGVYETDQLGKLVPSLTIAKVGPSNVYFVRGVGNFSVASTSDPAVALNYDGVYFNSAITPKTFFDLERVEVLKGPQGTLYGRNATAGVINVIPTQPKFGSFSGYASLSYGNYNDLVVEGAINLPVGDDGAVRLSGNVVNRDGYLSDGTSDDKSQAFRAQLKARLTPSLTVRAAFDYSHLGGAGLGINYLSTFSCNATTLTCLVKPTNIPRSDGNLSPAAQAFWTNQATRVTGRKYDPFPGLNRDYSFYGSNAAVEYDTGAGVLTLIPAVRFDELRHVAPGGGFPISNRISDLQYSAEARFAGKVGKVDYTLGFFYFNADGQSVSGSVTSGISAGFSSPSKIATQSYAPFARLTANLTSSLRVVGGLRYTHDAKQFSVKSITISESCAAGFTCADAILPTAVLYPSQLAFAIPVASGQAVPGPTPHTIISRSDISFDNHLSFGRVTWRAAAEYDVAPASMLYASVETGFRSGGFSSSVGYETYKPEYLTAYTIGSKNRFLANRVQLNVEAFWWDYTDAQVAHSGVDLIGRAGNFTQNIGKSRMKGVEVESSILVTPNSLLSADVQYLKARNIDFTYQQAKFLGLPRTLCKVSTNAANAALYDVDCAGLQSYNAPTWTFNLRGEQTIPIGDYKMVLSANTQHRSARHTNVDYRPEQVQAASWSSDAQLSFGTKDGRWSIAGYVRNIENNRLIVAGTGFLGLLSGYTSPPRTYGVRTSAKF
ncbi:TonB-dependent receptor [Sphingobium sp. SCG-1]|uniref:TonB-dependent receptor n=1 Tax=Sphingobium sp. SCG-1 TaxID=2072936 RepID=UPI001671211B|nr:TonB-dependent receptor [Sphingobium sp. SCG-1]